MLPWLEGPVASVLMPSLFEWPAATKTPPRTPRNSGPIVGQNVRAGFDICINPRARAAFTTGTIRSLPPLPVIRMTWGRGASIPFNPRASEIRKPQPHSNVTTAASRAATPRLKRLHFNGFNHVSRGINGQWTGQFFGELRRAREQNGGRFEPFTRSKPNDRTP